MTLRTKIKRLRKLRTDIRELEQSILNEGFERLQQPGQVLLAKPRLERIMEQFG